MHRLAPLHGVLANNAVFQHPQKVLCMLTVPHLQASRSQRVLWLLEELWISCANKVLPRPTRTRLAPAPLHTLARCIPVVMV